MSKKHCREKQTVNKLITDREKAKLYTPLIES